jgi:predicted permease
MNRWNRLLRRLDADLDEEIRAHLKLAAEDRIARGESPHEAVHGVNREFGNQLLIKEVTREMRSWQVIERIGHDLNYAFRQLRRNPAFAVVAIASLALGIGANSAIFSILNGLLLKSLPVQAPEELFTLQQQSQAAVPQRFSYPMFERLRDAGSGARAVAAMSRVTRAQATIGASSQPEMVPVQLVSGEFFPLLGLSASMGRLLTPADNANLGAHPVAVIGDGYWQRRFARSADAIGQTIRINGASCTIVGVAPEGFMGVWLESPTDVWIPLAMQADVHYSQNFSVHNDADQEKPWVPQEFIDWLDVIVRADPAKAGASREVLNSTFLLHLQAIAESLGPQSRRYFLERSLALDPFGHGASNIRGRFTTPLKALMAMVALVLLIACANAANLLLARAETRRREIAIRLSTGASRSRLIQQMVTESFLLVGLAAAFGLLVARWAAPALVRLVLGNIAGPPAPLASLDWHVLLFTAGIAIASGLLSGVAPAFGAARLELVEAMKTASPASANSRLRPAKFLVAAQVALALIVVFGAALFARSLGNLARAELGFDREHVLSVSINPRSAGYDARRLPALYRQLIDRAGNIAGVRSAAVAFCGLAVECRSSASIRVEGYEPASHEEVRAQYSYVSPAYFATVGMRLVKGRDFDGRDQGARSVIVNQALVSRYFNNRDPLGKRIGVAQIVGVVQNARVNRVREDAPPMFYSPLEGNPVYAGSLEVRAVGNPESIAQGVRQAIAEVAADLPVELITPLALQVDRSLIAERSGSVLAEVFGILALGLACVGLYGVMSYTVSRRTAEIGIRMALGANATSVLWEVLKEALMLIAIGLVAGLPIAMFTSRSIVGLLYGVQPNDPATLIAAVLVLSGIVLFAGVFPAWRASRVNPLVALRRE